MMLLIFCSLGLSALVYTFGFMDRVHRTIVRNGRTYQADIVPGHDGKLEVSVISVDDVDDQEKLISEIHGVISPEDFELFGKIFQPEFVAVATRQESEISGLRKLADARQAHPNHGGMWTKEMKKQALGLHRSGKSVEEIGAVMGRSANGIRALLRRMGVEVPFV
jgi:hypothetical protein